ncbi:MAG: PCP reductase family protein [Bryobacterales bacterium]|nr:PCP reductase family protein [Bryobacterales bacterium]
MNWNDAAEDLLQSILARTPRPIREGKEEQLRTTAERLAEDEGKNRVGVQTVVEAWVKTTPETLRSELPRELEQAGLDAGEYGYLFE